MCRADESSREAALGRCTARCEGLCRREVRLCPSVSESQPLLPPSVSESRYRCCCCLIAFFRDTLVAVFVTLALPWIERAGDALRAEALLALVFLEPLVMLRAMLEYILCMARSCSISLPVLTPEEAVFKLFVMLLVAAADDSFFLLAAEEVEEDLDFLAEETVLLINALPVSCCTSDSFTASSWPTSWSSSVTLESLCSLSLLISLSST